jgi:hypothetical protein
MLRWKAAESRRNTRVCKEKCADPQLRVLEVAKA